MMKREIVQTGIGAVMHFLVDGLCICCLYLMLPAYGGVGIVEAFLTYNILAFMTQPITGLWIDRIRNRHWVLLLSIVFLTLAVGVATLHSSFFTLRYSPFIYLSSLLLGFGNSLFHVWGGKQTVALMGNDLRALGVFVSTGAFGLAVGFVYCSWALLYVILIALCLLAFFVIQDSQVERISIPCEDSEYSLNVVWLSLVLLMAVVMFRSYVGQDFSTAIVKTPMLVLVIGAVSMLGKMAGGWLAKGFGIVNSMVVVLLVVLAAMLFRQSGTAVLLIGIFAINCTMAVTLWLANVVLKGREGLAFGLLAAALIPGYLLAVYM
jgi:hypothetical protein